MSKALDIRAQAIEEETARERQKLNYYFDLVTVKGTLRLSNGKNENVKMEISKMATGTVMDGGGAKVTKIARQLNSVNSQSILKWTASLKPGETKEIVYTYTVYVRV